MTSRQLSPSPATRRNHSPASLSLQSSFSKDSSFLVSSVVACRLYRRSGSLALAASRNEGNGNINRCSYSWSCKTGRISTANVGWVWIELAWIGLGWFHVAMAWHFLLQKHRYSYSCRDTDTSGFGRAK